MWKFWRPREALRAAFLRYLEAKARPARLHTTPVLAPWLVVDFDGRFPAGKWIFLRYRTSLSDPLMRPFIRIRTNRGIEERRLNAALFGRALWIGHVPFDALEISVSPALPSGAFELESARAISYAATTVLAWLCTDVPRFLLGVHLWCVGLRARGYAEVEAAIGSVPLEFYHEWRARNLRDFEPRGMDKPRVDLKHAPHIRIILDTSVESASASSTIASLADQVYQNWSVDFIAPDKILAENLEMAGSFSLDETVIAPVRAGDLLPKYALTLIAEHFVSHQNEEIAYGDEDSMDAAGRFCNPELKPDWSPVFQAGASYVGKALYLRASLLKRSSDITAADLFSPDFLAKIIGANLGKQIGHLRRIMLTKRRPIEERSATRMAVKAAADVKGVCAAIIIPSKDKPEMLAECIASVRRSRPSNFEVVIVDNGSTDPNTEKLYQELKSDPRIRIVEGPGPFNFSRLCNLGAASVSAPVLVFLNNDTVALEPDWLAPLIHWSLQADIGIVGVKLFYPSGTLQHGGVVLGHGGYAGHTEMGVPPASIGYLGGLSVPREVSAVTGACIAVEKRKFDMVGGFDAEEFPVDLNDIDLCLRLSDRGWKTLLTPQTVLMHHHSATRGRDLFAPEPYVYEKMNFRNRWHNRLRDDPYFHPCLSLHNTCISLE